MMCGECFEKTADGAFQCPQCRTWTLYGDKYGKPWKDGTHIKTLKKKDSPVDKLMDIISHLDGNITLIPRIGKGFMYVDLRINKLGDTARYSTDSLKVKHVRAFLKRLYYGFKAHTGYLDAVFKIYLLRQTYKINTKPVVEISVFQFMKNSLIQYPTDAWVNVFDEPHNSCFAKIEYIKPHVFTIPPFLSILFDDMNQKYLFKKTISFAYISDDEADEIDGSINFDVGADGNPNTMTQSMIDSIIFNLSRCQEVWYIMMRIFTGPDDKTADLVTFEIESHQETFKQLTIWENKQLFNRNLDGLKTNKDAMLITFI
jgi:hypothetical protein